MHSRLSSTSFWVSLCLFLWCLFPAGCACLCSSLPRYQAEAVWESEQQRHTLNHQASGRNAGRTTGEEHLSPLLLLCLTLLDTAEVRQRSLVKEKMHLRLLTAQEIPSCLCDPVKPAEERAALCRQCGTVTRLSYLFHYSAKNPSPYFAGGRLPDTRQKECRSPHHCTAKTQVGSFTVSKSTSS